MTIQYQYDEPIGPVRPGEVIRKGGSIQYDEPIGPVRPGEVIRKGGSIDEVKGDAPDTGYSERAEQILKQDRAEAERKKQAELRKQREQNKAPQKPIDTTNQAVVTDRRPTLSSGGTPVRNVEFGNKYAEYERRLNEEARLKGRNLGIGEREKIAGEVYNQPVQTQEQKVIVAKEGKVSLPIDTNTKYYPGVTLEPRPLYYSKVGPGAANFIVGSTPGINTKDMTRQGTVSNLSPSLKIEQVKIEQVNIPSTKQIYTLPSNIKTKTPTTSTTIQSIPQAPEIPSFVSLPPTKIELSRQRYIEGKPTIFGLTESMREQSRQESFLGKRTGYGIATGITAGALTSVIGTYDFGKGMITHPIQTIAGVTKTIIELPKRIPEMLSSGKTIIRTDPAFATGFIVVEVAQMYAFNKGYKFAIQRQVTIKSLRQTLTPQFIEKQIYVVNKGNQFRVATYEITGELKPPRLKITTTRLRETFGFKPIKTEYIKPQNFLVRTTKPVINNYPFEVAEVRTGSNIIRYKQISGSSKMINPRVERMSNIDKFLLKRYVEGVTGKQPTSYDIAKIFTPRGSEFELSDISTIKTTKYNIKTKRTTFIDNDILKSENFKSIKIRFGNEKTYAEVDYGKVRLEAGKGRMSETSRAITRTKEFIDLPDYEILTTKTYFKDVTKPFSRASGKTPQLEGTIFIKKEPIVIGNEPVNFIQPRDITKTPWSRTFPKTVQIQRPQLTKILPNIKPISTTTKVTPTTTTQSITPKLSSITTNQVQTKQPIVFEGRIPANQLKGLSFEKSFEGQGNINIGINKEVSKNIFKTMNKELTKEQPKFMEKTISKEMTKSLVKQQPKQMQKQSLKQVMKQTYKLSQKNLNPSFPRLTKPKTPKTPTPFLFKPFKQPKQLKERFNVFGRRFGKFKSIGFGRTESEAFSIGKEFARNTLGVTFKVPNTKARRLPGYQTKIRKGEVFYMEPNVRRLKRGTKELPEIQFYKNLKGGRKNVMQI